MAGASTLADNTFSSLYVPPPSLFSFPFSVGCPSVPLPKWMPHRGSQLLPSLPPALLLVKMLLQLRLPALTHPRPPSAPKEQNFFVHGLTTAEPWAATFPQTKLVWPAGCGTNQRLPRRSVQNQSAPGLMGVLALSVGPSAGCDGHQMSRNPSAWRPSVEISANPSA